MRKRGREEKREGREGKRKRGGKSKEEKKEKLRELGRRLWRQFVKKKKQVSFRLPPGQEEK